MGSFSYAILSAKDVRLVVITLQLSQLILFKKWNKITLILSQSKISQKLGHPLKFQEIEEVCLFYKLLFRSFMPLEALLALFVKMTLLTTAAKNEYQRCDKIFTVRVKV